jgi:hypothetical protein
VSTPAQSPALADHHGRDHHAVCRVPVMVVDRRRAGVSGAGVHAPDLPDVQFRSSWAHASRIECVDTDELDCVRAELERREDENRALRAEVHTHWRSVRALTFAVNDFEVNEVAMLRGNGVRQRRLDDVQQALHEFAMSLKIKHRSSNRPSETVAAIRREIERRHKEARAYLDKAIHHYELSLNVTRARAEQAEAQVSALKQRADELERNLVLSVRASTPEPQVVREVHVIEPLRSGRRKRIWGWRCDTCGVTMNDPSEHKDVRPNS